MVNRIHLYHFVDWVQTNHQKRCGTSDHIWSYLYSF